MTASRLIHDLAALGVVVSIEDGHLALMPASRVPPELLEAIKANKAALLEMLTTSRPAPTLAKPINQVTLEPLPLELRTLVRAAAAGTLPNGAVSLGTGLTLNLERYVLGFAAQYLTGDQSHAILELQGCLSAWQATTRKAFRA